MVKNKLFSRAPKDWKGFELTRDDFEIGLNGVTIGYNSNIIKYIMKIQKDSRKLDEIKIELDKKYHYGVAESMRRIIKKE